VRFKSGGRNAQHGAKGEILEGAAEGELPELVWKAGDMPVFVREEDGLRGAFLAWREGGREGG